MIGPILYVWPSALQHLGVPLQENEITYQIGLETGQITTLRLDQDHLVPGATFYPRSEHGRANALWAPDTYVQLIYTARVPAYASGRMCLIGDAGSVAQPFTGSGVFKGHNNVVGLLEALSTHGDLDDALATWSNEQVHVADHLLALGKQMEQAFIWDPLDLTSADAPATEAWWRESVTFPDEFTYEDGG